MDKKANDTIELIMRATVEYKNSIHSVTNQNPLDVIHATSVEFRQKIKKKSKRHSKLYLKDVMQPDTTGFLRWAKRFW